MPTPAKPYHRRKNYPHPQTKARLDAIAEQPFQSVTDDVSDLFFNMDHDNARNYETGPRKLFEGFIHEELLNNAKFLAERLNSLGVGDVPSPESIVHDFYRRV